MKVKSSTPTTINKYGCSESIKLKIQFVLILSCISLIYSPNIYCSPILPESVTKAFNGSLCINTDDIFYVSGIARFTLTTQEDFYPDYEYLDYTSWSYELISYDGSLLFQGSLDNESVVMCDYPYGITELAWNDAPWDNFGWLTEGYSGIVWDGAAVVLMSGSPWNLIDNSNYLFSSFSAYGGSWIHNNEYQLSV